MKYEINDLVMFKPCFSKTWRVGHVTNIAKDIHDKEDIVIVKEDKSTNTECEPNHFYAYKHDSAYLVKIDTYDVFNSTASTEDPTIEKLLQVILAEVKEINNKLPYNWWGETITTNKFPMKEYDPDRWKIYCDSLKNIDTDIFDNADIEAEDSSTITCTDKDAKWYYKTPTWDNTLFNNKKNKDDKK